MSHLVVPITITIAVTDIDTVIATYDQIQVHRSTDGESGTYAEITTEKTRVVLVAGQTAYTYDDDEGSDEYWYKFRYYDSDTPASGSFSTPQRGAPDPALEIISIAELKEFYLFGLDLTNDAGEPYPDSLYAHYIRSALGSLEKNLDIKISRVQYTEERHDYFRQDYVKHMFVKLFHQPVISVESVKIFMPGEAEIIDFENDWIHIQRAAAHVEIVPGLAAASSTWIGLSGVWLPLAMRRYDFLPDAFRIAYTAGFGVKRGTGVSPSDPDFDKVPDDIKDLVGKIASFGPLNIAGDLLGGAGIASQSISVDGLAQSFNTTCLVPETEILLVNENTKTMAELAAMGEPFSIRTVDQNYAAITARAARAFPTIKTRVCRVLLSNGRLVECSDDELFMLRDGRWVEAAKLEPSAELMPAEGLAGDNVRVMEVHRTSEIRQMFDIEVPNYACFALGAGIVVHNSSSTSAGYGARLKQYALEIKLALPVLRNYYRGIKIVAV